MAYKNKCIDLDLVGIANYIIEKLLYEYKFSSNDIFDCIEKHFMYLYDNVELLRMVAHEEFGLDEIADDIRGKLLEEYPKYK